MPVRKIKTEDGRISYELLDDEGATVPEVNGFLAYSLNRGLSPNTVKAQAYDLQYLVRFLASLGLTFAEFRPKHCVDLLAFLQTQASRSARRRLGLALVDTERSGGPAAIRLAPASIARALAHVSSFYEYLILTDEYATENPLQKVEDKQARMVSGRRKPALGRASRQVPIRRRVSVKQINRLPRPMPREDVERLLASLRTARDRALFLLLVNGGLRPSEALTLELADVQYGLRRVRVRVVHDDARGLRTKSREERIVDLHDPDTLAAISAYVMQERPRDTGSPLLFLVGGKGTRRGEPLSYWAVHRLFTRHCDRLGIRTPWTTPHALRHTHATEMYRHGMREMTLQKRLGHRSPQSTKVYTRVGDELVVADYSAAVASLAAAREAKA